MDAFMIIHILDEKANLIMSIGEIAIIRQVHLLFFDVHHYSLSFGG
jgi:hypothetical protein